MAVRFALIAVPILLFAGCLTEVPENPPGVLRVVEHSLSCAPPDTCEVPVCERGREIVDGPCCDDCGHIEGEPCGGIWGTAGTCNPGLHCELPPAEPDGPISVDPVGTCVDRCADFYYQVCTADSDCEAGYACGRPNPDCTPTACECDPTTGRTGFCTRDCALDVGLCEPLGVEGDACGVWALPVCDEGLSCLGGFPAADQPGTCLVAPVCNRMRFDARCRGGDFVAGGRMMRRFAGQLVHVAADGVEYETRVRRNGSFFVRGEAPRGAFTVEVVGCEGVHSISLTCPAE